MRMTTESLKRLYEAEKVKEEKLNEMVAKGTISVEEKLYITKTILKIYRAALGASS